jgi:hypothetical protein
MDLDSALTDKPADGATATDILRADHREVDDLFNEYYSAGGDAHARGVIAQTLCMQLELHDQIEREVFYPAASDVDPDAVEHAESAHETIAAAVERVRVSADASRDTAAAVAELRALVMPHVEEEEQRLFPLLEQRSESWLRELGCALVARKEELTRSTESFEGPAT